MTAADILAATYYDRCTIYRPIRSVTAIGETVYLTGRDGQVMGRDIPCALSSPSGGGWQRGVPTATAMADYTLFLSPKTDIGKGDMVVVYQAASGQEIELIAGLPMHYPSHTQLPLHLQEERV